MYTLYILKCKDNTLYTGIAKDLEARMQAHHEGRGAKYTKGRGPFQLLHSEEFPDRSSASKREAEIKKWSRAQKHKFLNERATTKITPTNPN